MFLIILSSCKAFFGVGLGVVVFWNMFIRSVTLCLYISRWPWNIVGLLLFWSAACSLCLAVLEVCSPLGVWGFLVLGCIQLFRTSVGWLFFHLCTCHSLCPAGPVWLSPTYAWRTPGIFHLARGLCLASIILSRRIVRQMWRIPPVPDSHFPVLFVVHIPRCASSFLHLWVYGHSSVSCVQQKGTECLLSLSV